MIRQLTGSVAHIGIDKIVIDVNGVGYLVYVGNPSAFKLDEKIKLHTYLAVRETALDLYGFLTLDELEIFELLLTLPKIGPKSAAQVLAQADVVLLKTAVANNDAVHLSKMSGVGKKTAEKIVSGLKEIFEDRGLVPEGALGEPSGTSQQPYQADAIDALITLGYPQADARRAIQALPPGITTTNEAVTTALKELGKNS